MGIPRALRHGAHQRSAQMHSEACDLHTIATGATKIACSAVVAIVEADCHSRRECVRRLGALGTAAALLGRFAIIEAGRASASDPRATFGPQRDRRTEAPSRQGRG